MTGEQTPGTIREIPTAHGAARWRANTVRGTTWRGPREPGQGLMFQVAPATADDRKMTDPPLPPDGTGKQAVVGAATVLLFVILFSALVYFARVNDPGPGGHDPCYDFTSQRYPELSADGYYHCGENGTRLIACYQHQERLVSAGLEPTVTSCPNGTWPP